MIRRVTETVQAKQEVLLMLAKKSHDNISFLMIVSLAILLLFSRSGFAQQDDVVFKAMNDEMQRTKARLQMGGLEKPYFVEYTIAEMDQFNADASFGGVTYSQRDKKRYLKAGVRVGDYRFDNTNFVSASSFGASPLSVRQITTDGDYEAIRQSLWLASDQAYKNALEGISKKRAYAKNVMSSEEIDDFSKEEPRVSVKSKTVLTFDEHEWVQSVKEYSAVFKKYSKINGSNVYSRISSVQKYYLNSEGFRVLAPQTTVALVVVATTQSQDGMQVKDYVTFYGKSMQEFPSKNEVMIGIEKLANELSEARDARVLDFYTGPVLFTGRGSAEFFRQMLGENLSGTRPPMADNRWTRSSQETAFKNKLKMKVLPSFVSVSDNPLQLTFNEKPLIGSYSVDDEGVPAREVRVVENGILKSFLMSRIPRKEFANSNGHGRGPISSSADAKMGNLFVLSSKTSTYNDLKNSLIHMCKEQDKEYGIIVKALDEPAITAGTSRGLFGGSSESSSELTQPLLVYKVYVKDGREELVRGLEFSEITLRSLKDIIATGNDYYVHNFMNPTSSRYPSSVSLIPTSIVAPSILIEEMDLKKVSGEQEKPPFLAHPFFAK
jgi:predicted Zn-dependent protease